MISVKYLFAVRTFLLSGFMSFIEAGIVTYVNMGLIDNFMSLFIKTWLSAYLVAFPTLLLIFPLAHRLATKIASKA